MTGRLTEFTQDPWPQISEEEPSSHAPALTLQRTPVMPVGHMQLQPISDHHGSTRGIQQTTVSTTQIKTSRLPGSPVATIGVDTGRSRKTTESSACVDGALIHIHVTRGTLKRQTAVSPGIQSEGEEGC